MPSMQIIIDINTDEYLASVSQCYKDDELDLKDHIFLSILSDVVFSQVKSNTDLADKITRGLLKKIWRNNQSRRSRRINGSRTVSSRI